VCAGAPRPTDPPNHKVTRHGQRSAVYNECPGARMGNQMSGNVRHIKRVGSKRARVGRVTVNATAWAGAEQASGTSMRVVAASLGVLSHLLLDILQ
jgi:hypothetical protein